MAGRGRARAGACTPFPKDAIQRRMRLRPTDQPVSADQVGSQFKEKGMDMNIQKLGVEVKTEQQTLRELKAKAIDRQVQAKAAKAKAKAAKLDYKKVRAAAKNTKKLLMEAEEKVEQQRRVLAKAEKRLAKALSTLHGPPKVRAVPAVTPDVKPTPRPRPREALAPFALSAASPG